jgi:hypothetical protein
VRRIGFCFPGYTDATLFDPGHRENSHEPFIALRARLRQHGFSLEGLSGDDPSGFDALWFWDVTLALQPRRSRWSRKAAELSGRPAHGPSLLMRRALRGPLRDRLVLFMGEPPIVSPANWDRRLHRPFRTIFTWHDPLADGRRYFKFFFPLPERWPLVEHVPFSQRRLLVNISGNKSSPEPGELYSARVESIRSFERIIPDDFDLYGRGWEKGDTRGMAYPSFRGAPEHKWDVLPHYRFSLCYENQRLQGYVTEKLFDCLRCGVVPVYLGAPEIADVVDPRCFIDRRDFADEAELVARLRAMTEREFAARQEAARAVLGSQAFARHLSPAFVDTVCTALQLTPETR